MINSYCHNTDPQFSYDYGDSDINLSGGKCQQTDDYRLCYFQVFDYYVFKVEYK